MTVNGQKSKTVAKALEILEEFMHGPPVLGVSDLSARTRLAPAVVQRIVNSLSASGYLEQDPRSRRYTLGLRVLQLGATVANFNRLMIAAQPTAQRLNEETGEVVLLTVLDRRKWRGAYIHVLDAAVPGTLRLRLQQQGYLHASSTRKVLLAHLTSEEIQHVLTRVGMPRLTPNTITDPRILLDELEQIRRNGYAVSRGEASAGTTGVAAPIRDRGGAVVASIGASVPDSRLTDARLRRIRRMVVQAAIEISQALNRLV